MGNKYLNSSKDGIQEHLNEKTAKHSIIESDYKVMLQDK